MITRILVPLDGSGLAERALDEAVPLAQRLGATIVLERIVEPQEEARLYLPGTEQELRQAQVQAAEEYLSAIAARIASDRLSLETHVGAGPVAATICDQTKRLHCDLIALTSHGMGGLGEHVFGSVAQKLLQSAPAPVLVVRSTKGHLQIEEEAEERAADRAQLRELSGTAPKRSWE
jgi:nucleotide-binding universal stress UspA family protein